MSHFQMPSQQDIVTVLREHPLIRLRDRVQRAFVVGSFAAGAPRDDSDVDVLLEVAARTDCSAPELEERYRKAIRAHLMLHNIRGKDDSQHPQWCGRRIDVYFTYDADLETRPKIMLVAAAARVSSAPSATTIRRAP